MLDANERESRSITLWGPSSWQHRHHHAPAPAPPALFSSGTRWVHDSQRNPPVSSEKNEHFLRNKMPNTILLDLTIPNKASRSSQQRDRHSPGAGRAISLLSSY